MKILHKLAKWRRANKEFHGVSIESLPFKLSLPLPHREEIPMNTSTKR